MPAPRSQIIDKPFRQSFEEHPKFKSWDHVELTRPMSGSTGPIAFLTPRDSCLSPGRKTPPENRAIRSKIIPGEGQKGSRAQHPPGAGPNVLGDVKFPRMNPE